MTDATPTPAPAAPAPATPPPTAAADLTLTPGQEARAQIQVLKQDGAWVKRYFDGDPAAKAQLRDLQTREAEHNYSTGQLIFGGPSVQEQRDLQATYLADKGVPPDVVAEVRAGNPVSASEYQQAVAMWDAKKADPEWRAALERGDFKAKQEHALLMVIRSSRIDTSLR